jgi:predicted xylose isomerase-like sugar epimerase
MQIMAHAKKKGITHILICRVGSSGDLLPVEPCPKCRATASKLGIVISSIPARNSEENEK